MTKIYRRIDPEERFGRLGLFEEEKADGKHGVSFWTYGVSEN